MLQVHARTIENWENPKDSNVPYERMQELADVLNVDKRWLLHGDPEPAQGSADETLAEILRRLGELEETVQRSIEATQEAVRTLRESQRQAAPTRKRRPRATGTDSG